MQTKVIVTISSVIFLALTSPIYAVDSTTTPPAGDQRKIERENIRKESKDNRQEVRKEMQQLKSDTREEVSKMRDALKVSREADREAFKAKLATLKDEQKKATAARVDTRLATMNDNRTTQMSESLSKLKEILNKLITKTNEAKTAGGDTATVEIAINKAKASISTSETTIASQKAKTYTATITDEATLRNSFSTTYKQLLTDLEGTRETLKGAKTDVRDVAKSLRDVEIAKQ